MLTLALVVAVSTTASANNKLAAAVRSPTYLNPGVEAGADVAPRRRRGWNHPWPAYVHQRCRHSDGAGGVARGPRACQSGFLRRRVGGVDSGMGWASFSCLDSAAQLVT